MGEGGWQSAAETVRDRASDRAGESVWPGDSPAAYTAGVKGRVTDVVKDAGESAS